MENINSPNLENEINRVIEKLEYWKKLFLIDIQYYQEGWAISLREKSFYPRYIVIFKPYNKKYVKIKSFEINLEGNKEKFRELYYTQINFNLTHLISEIKEIIYGKDLLNNAFKNLQS